MSGVEKVNYVSVGETVGIYVTIDGESHLFSREDKLRERIAEEIEDHCYCNKQPILCWWCEAAKVVRKLP